MKKLLFMVISLLLLGSIGWGSDPPQKDLNVENEVTVILDQDQAIMPVMQTTYQSATVPEVTAIYSLQMDEIMDYTYDGLRPVLQPNMILITVNRQGTELDDGLICHPSKAGDKNYTTKKSNSLTINSSIHTNLIERLSPGDICRLVETA